MAVSIDHQILSIASAQEHIVTRKQMLAAGASAEIRSFLAARSHS